MSRRSFFQRALFACYDRIQYMKFAYPKAARRRRIMKKWRNRFGVGFTEYLLENPNRPSFFYHLESYDGGNFPIPPDSP